MATSGRIDGSYPGASSYKPYIKWSVTQSTAANTSTMTATFGMRKVSANSASFNLDSQTLTVVINGTTYTRSITFDYRTAAVGSDNDITTFSGISIPHNADGTKSVTISAKHPTDISFGIGSVNGTAVLTDIPRATVPEIPASADIGDEITISLPRANNSWVHTLSYKFGSDTWYRIAPPVNDDPNVGTSYDWTIPMSLCSQLTDAASGTLTIRAVTYSGATQIGQATATMVVSVPSTVKPTASLSVSLVNDNSTVDGWGVAVKGYTKLSYTITGDVTSDYGATVSGFELTADNQTFDTATGTTGVINSSGNVEVKARVRDSRGVWSDYDTETVTFLDYTRPEIIEADAWRVDSNGDPSDEGEAVKVKCNAACAAIGSNAVTIGCRYRQAGASGWTTYSGSITNNTATLLSGITFTKTVSFEVELSATDSLGNKTSLTFTIPTALVPFNLKKSNNGAAFGKYATTDNLLEVAEEWGFLAHKNVQMLFGTDALPASANLNDYIMPRVWYCTTENAPTIVNAPYRNYGFKLTVERVGNSSSSNVQQTVTTPSSALTFFIRRKVDGVWKPWQQLSLKEGVIQYQEATTPGWHVQLARSGYVTADMQKNCSGATIEGSYSRSGVAYSTTVYLPLPYPMGSMALTGAGKAGGIYVSNVYHNNSVGASFKLISPMGGNDGAAIASDANVRLSLNGAVADPPANPPGAITVNAAADALGLAQSYVDAAAGGRSFAYDYNWFHYPGNSARNELNTNGAGRVQCDTYMGLVLRGIGYEDSPYYPGDDPDNPSYPETYNYGVLVNNPGSRSWVTPLLSGMLNNSYFGRDLVYAADLAWLMWYQKRVFSNLSQAAPGDLVFWNDPYDASKTYFGHVTHIAMLDKEDNTWYVYEASGYAAYENNVIHKVTLDEAKSYRGEPCYYARPYYNT